MDFKKIYYTGYKTRIRFKERKELPPSPAKNKQPNKNEQKKKTCEPFSQYKNRCQGRQQEENLGNGVEVKNYIVQSC